MNTTTRMLFAFAIFANLVARSTAQSAFENTPFTFPPQTGEQGALQVEMPKTSSLTLGGSTPIGGGTVIISPPGMVISPPSTVITPLLPNWSFETGDFTGWSVSGNATVVNGNSSDGSYSCLLNSGDSTPNAIISHSFATTPGSAYRITFDYKTTAQAVDQGLRVEVLDGSSQDLVLSGFGGSPSFVTHSALFVAKTAVTTLRFTDIANFNSAVDGVLDNIKITAVDRFRRPGKYTGTLVTSHGFPYEKLATKTTKTVEARINEAGQMFILIEPDYDGYALGTIANDGSVTLGDQNNFSGQATFSPAGISFKVSEAVHLPGNFYAEPHLRTRVYSLIQVGP